MDLKLPHYYRKIIIIFRFHFFLFGGSNSIHMASVIILDIDSIYSCPVFLGGI